MKKAVKINESKLRKIITESLKNVLNEAEDYGWEVPDYYANEAYDFFAEQLGNEEANKAIVACMSDEEMAKCLVYLFRQYDFQEWKEKLAELEENR